MIVAFRKIVRAFSVVATGVLFLTFAPAYAQVSPTPAPLNGAVINWSTKTYVPAGFQGKRLPTSGSDITTWVTVFISGKPVSTSGYTVSWYVNNQLLRSGNGLSSITFKAPRATSQIVNLQVRTQSPNGNLFVANIQAPIVNPVVAIRADYPRGVFVGPSANVSALPYFFNISSLSSLSFRWSANGATAENAENPDAATVNLGGGASSGTKIRIQVTVTNLNDSTVASAYTNLTYQKT